ncbi:NADH dehydrogenase [Oceanobacillus iheyensis HTE831]|uniref:NADH dehydrogenase n=1 Tax=Oceanobacillus iheyensis (strain DSM 14371 / CIP 107618 / JCM 11309 / KCTC 3954 / HTE831) TaxID=221109 RepID=Q8ENX5_OCEIH|nr:NAD(P)/FAD-dependent oxidoreductase [Oceanobacillus iheyensis]BAC14306.1 NADH dehydrogenase [Oceanobacillus iheyensis HTE831]
MNKPHIVILGAGYGGMMAAARMQKLIHSNEAKITLVNKNDYHYQTTWLHENAAGTLHHDRSKIDIKEVIDRNRIKLILDEVVSIKREEKKVKLKNQELYYDILIVSLGFEPAIYGIPGLSEFAYSIKDINSARLIRERIEYNFALYTNENKPTDGRLNIVIGGGGLTGVEFAGELINRIPTICEEYDIEKNLVKVYLLEGRDCVLYGYDDSAVQYAMNSLQSRGVEIINDATVKACAEDSIIYEKGGSEHKISTKSVIWTAGTKANSIVERLNLSMEHGRVKVRNDLRSIEDDSIYLIGDCSLNYDENGNVLPSTAQIAMQQGEFIARNINAKIKGKEMAAFLPDVPGRITSLGSDDGIADMFSRNLFGWKAALLKRVADNWYLFKLGGIQLLMKKGKFNMFH